MKTIVFVCTGNTCRSPMAEALMKHYLKEEGLDTEYQVCSAGVGCYYSSPASEHSQKVMEEKGLDISTHRAQNISKEIVKQATFIFTMTQVHKSIILHHFPEQEDKVFTLKEFVEQSGDVVDPFGGSLLEYQMCGNEIQEILQDVIIKLKELSISDMMG